MASKTSTQHHTTKTSRRKKWRIKHNTFSSHTRKRHSEHSMTPNTTNTPAVDNNSPNIRGMAWRNMAEQGTSSLTRYGTQGLGIAYSSCGSANYIFYVLSISVVPKTWTACLVHVPLYVTGKHSRGYEAAQIRHIRLLNGGIKTTFLLCFHQVVDTYVWQIVITLRFPWMQ